jgi:predicted AAA+ superfamily ATPase
VNLKKRLVKAPKLYFRDSGLLHGLLEIEDQQALLGHPALGASWEGWCIEQILAALPRWRPSFYRDSNGQEVDLILERGERRLAFECKVSLAPELTRAGIAALELLRPERALVVCPTDTEGYDLARGVRVCGIAELLETLAALQPAAEEP